MSRDEVEMLLGIGDNQYRNRGSQQYDDLELRIQIERNVDACSPDSELSN